MAGSVAADATFLRDLREWLRCFDLFLDLFNVFFLRERRRRRLLRSTSLSESLVEVTEVLQVLQDIDPLLE